MADALWELAGRHEVGVWYECRRGYWSSDCSCDAMMNVVRLYQPHCRTAEECVEQILREYRREVESLREPPRLEFKPPDPVEKLLREWPELSVFSVEWMKAWTPNASERLAEIARVLRIYP